MAKPEDLGPLLFPGQLEVGGVYYFGSTIFNEGIPVYTTLGRYDKVTVISIDVTPQGEQELQYELNFIINSTGRPLHRRFVTNKETDNYISNRFYGRFFGIETDKKQAQINTLRNLGRSGKVPMNIAMHKLPSYLGLGGKRKTRRGRKAKN